MNNSLKFIIIIFITIAIFYACIGKPGEQIKNVEWLIGTWENKTSRGSIFETWEKTSQNELSGKSYILLKNDTMIFETIRLIRENDSLFYIPSVRNQNDNLPVRFSLKSVSDSLLVFENPQHDFPQIISYSKINHDSLVAEISGFQNSTERKQIFPMRRIK